MKKLVFFLLLIISASVSAQVLEGAFKITAAQYGDKPNTPEELIRRQIIKIFKDGYWISAFYGDPQKPFSGSGGGTFTTVNGKYTERLLFYSWDSTAVGDVYNFDYRLEGNRYFQNGKMNSDKYPDHVIKEEFVKMKTDIPLKNNSLEGTWILQGATWDSKDAYEQPIEQIKIYAYPRFAWAQYNSTTKQFIGAGGGTYQFDGKNVTEHIEYITYNSLALSTDVNVEVKKLANGTMQQTTWQGRMVETWKKAK